MEDLLKIKPLLDTVVHRVFVTNLLDYVECESVSHCNIYTPYEGHNSANQIDRIGAQLKPCAVVASLFGYQYQVN